MASWASTNAYPKTRRARRFRRAPRTVQLLVRLVLPLQLVLPVPHRSVRAAERLLRLNTCLDSKVADALPDEVGLGLPCFRCRVRIEPRKLPDRVPGRVEHVLELGHRGPHRGTS